MTGRLSTLAAAIVIARRDFGAILLNRSFIFFLLGPLFPLIVGIMAGGSARKSSKVPNALNSASPWQRKTSPRCSPHVRFSTVGTGSRSRAA